MTSVGEDGGKLEPPFTTGGKAKWCSHFGKQSGSSSNGSAQSYDVTQKLYSQALSQEK